MSDLLPCPFCGAEMQLITDSGLLAFVHPSGECVLRNRAWYVRTDAARWNTRSVTKEEG